MVSNVPAWHTRLENINPKSMSFEQAITALCVAGLRWMNETVHEWLEPCSQCRGWWKATEALVARLKAVGFLPQDYE